MKLKNVLVHIQQLNDEIRTMRMNVEFCEGCVEGTTQNEHRDFHLERAIEILERLPTSIGQAGGSGYKNKIVLVPEIKLTVDETGHITIDVWDVNIH